MGAVYRARHAFLRRPTAVKLIRSQVASSEALARFEREVQLTSALSHPNTIAIYDYGRTEEGIFYYAMEYLPGIPLDRLVKDEGPQPQARVVHLLKQICASLAEAHRIGLVHRDVKPANVMLCERGGLYDVVKVLDFGLVKDVATDDAGAHRRPSHRRDAALHGPGVHQSLHAGGCAQRRLSVGGVAYALITGQPVFTGKSGVDVIGHHLHSIPLPPSERLSVAVDPFLERLILNCLSKRPEDRPADAGALLAQIEEGWKGETWTQAEARVWWETRAPAMLEARRAAETSASQGPNLEVDVDSRVASARSADLSAPPRRAWDSAPGVIPSPRGLDLSRWGMEETNDQPPAVVARGLDAASVGFDDGTAQGEVDAEAFALRRLEGNEQPRERVVVERSAGILDRGHDRAADRGRADAQERVAWRHAGHGVEGVPHEAQDHLLDLDAVAEALGKAGAPDRSSGRRRVAWPRRRAGRPCSGPSGCRSSQRPRSRPGRPDLPAARSDRPAAAPGSVARIAVRGWLTSSASTGGRLARGRARRDIPPTCSCRRWRSSAGLREASAVVAHATASWFDASGRLYAPRCATGAAR
jgi:hypothetical protein